MQKRFAEAVEIFGSEFEDYQKTIENEHQTVLRFESDSRIELDILKGLLTDSLRAKKSLSSIFIELDSSSLDAIYREYQSIMEVINTNIREINERVHDIQGSTEDENKSSIELYENKKKVVESKLMHIEETDCCTEWLRIKAEADILASDIKKKSKELEDNQQTYLDKYFMEIDSMFTKYGGRKFRIERGESSNRGYKKVFGIKIYFNGELISKTKKTSKVFSESDRRALALSIFMAKILCMSQEEQQQMILVLDDPVTSFDDNRIKPVINSIIEIYPKMDQTFILTHHFMFSRIMYLSNGPEIEYYKLKHISADNNGIFEIKPDEEFATEFYRLFDKITSFINYNSDNLTVNDIRIFLEEYLGMVFVKLYKDNGLAQKKLAERIDNLETLGALSKDAAAKLHQYRKTLNPESHGPSQGNLEDLRNCANEMLTLLLSIPQLNS